MDSNDSDLITKLEWHIVRVTILLLLLIAVLKLLWREIAYVFSP